MVYIQKYGAMLLVGAWQAPTNSADLAIGNAYYYYSLIDIKNKAVA